MERRFEEYRYRLSCALKTIHDYEDEISKLRSRLAKLESKSQEGKTDTDKELEQIHKYTEQLEEQFTAQVAIIEALKRKMVQVTRVIFQLVNDNNKRRNHFLH